MTADGDTLPCPTCGHPVAIAEERQPPAFPFCSPRCRLRDLGAWADGRHVIPGQPVSYDPYAPDLDHQ